MCCELDRLTEADYPFAIADYVSAEKRYSQYRTSAVVTGLAPEPIKHHVAWYLAQDTFTDLASGQEGGEGTTVLDWGAHEGETSATLAYLFPDLSVHAFEPSEESYGKLVDLAGLISRIKPVKIDDSDRKHFSIDDYVKRNQLPRVAAINLRMEGSDLPALLAGASETIKKDHPKLCIRVDHLRSDLFEVPIYLKSHFPEYRLSFQHQGAHIFGSRVFAT